MANDNKYTPATIGEELFSIPLYQRLFEWTSEEITQLLRDLYDSFKKAQEQKIPNNEKPYYIGMLTSYVKEGKERIDLVDGQQRFTVMMLFSIALGWKDFYNVYNEPRLTFYAREQDTEYIKDLCGLDNNLQKNYFNKNMKSGIECIQTFFQDSVDKNERNQFSEYIYNNMTFFISTLPSSYELSDLNKYFESMNSAGRALENHEVLKVKLLKKLTENNTEYSLVWNIVSNMDKLLLRKKTENKTKESAKDFRERYSKALEIAKKNPIEFFDYEKEKCIINDIYIMTEEESKNYLSIKDIVPSSVEPEEKELNTSEIGLFSFPLFLLLVLYITLNDSSVAVAEFFKVNNLLETFENYDDKYDVKQFFQNLLYYRLVLDYYFIRQGDDDEPYVLKNYVYDDEDGTTKETSINEKQKLIQFQSMLFVSSTPVTFYRWVAPIFLYIRNSEKEITPEQFLNKLKGIDNSIDEHNKNNIYSLTYKTIDRYWFWRLDYYLWERRKELFLDSKELSIADNYIFKRNRSIEHIAPQSPKSNSSIQWNDKNIDIRDCFGNLAMISSGQNSSLQNESYELKRAHVESYINQSKTDTIESLKMLKVYEAKKWDFDTIKKHEKEMIKILEDSFEL